METTQSLLETAPSFGVLNYCILFIYLGVLFGVGLYLAGRQQTTEDYFLAGRRMPWYVVCMSMFASLTSAISFMAHPGLAFRENTAQIVTVLGCLIASPFIVLFFYPFYRKLKVTTSYEYIYRRYGSLGRYLASALFILARMGWLGIVIYAPAAALSAVTGINVYFAIILMGIMAVAYTVLGGLTAVLWTDAIQFILLVGGAVWVAITLVVRVPGGVAEIISLADEAGKLQFLDMSVHLPEDLFKMSGTLMLVGVIFAVMYDYGTDQVTVQRLLAVKNFRGTVKAIIVNAFTEVFVVSLLLFIGLGLYAYYHHYPGEVTEKIRQGDSILPYYIIRALPAGVSGAIITAIFAAAMSSMDSGINSLSTVIVNDFVKPLRRRERSDRQDVALARILTLILGAFAMVVAYFAAYVGELFKAVGYFTTLFSGPVLSLFLLGIFTRRVSFWSWVAGAVVGVGTLLYVQIFTEIHFIYYFNFSLFPSLLVGYLASFIISSAKAPAELTIWGRGFLKSVD